ncbi:MAG: hypothetical protein HYR60_26340 [Acidobacteria bacterium]|nr:hypothetical protein [Acidobacteriota bacterium]MBI3473284.1 hypothetical protein [Candidatus Solibacter usitatus]
MPVLNAFNTLSVIVIVLAIWVGRMRFTGKFDSNHPLLFYAVLVFYTRAYEGRFQNYFIFAGVVAALFLRFEFLGGWFLKAFRLIEFLVLCYVVFTAFSLLEY